LTRSRTCAYPPSWSARAESNPPTTPGTEPAGPRPPAGDRGPL